MNEYAVWTHTCAPLHAGALRSPTGDIVLLANTLNLARAGQIGPDTLSDLATIAPTHRLTHGDTHQAVAQVAKLTNAAATSR